MLASAMLLAANGFAAGADDALITFSTNGAEPDRYADGEVVLDGECYALVWSRDGVFEGINVDGTTVDPADQVVLVAAVAQNGHRPEVVFQISAERAEALAEGKYGVVLLDTRVKRGEKVVPCGTSNGRLALVNGMAPIVAPLIGSQLLSFMSWPGIFWLLSGYGLLVLVAAVFLIVETLPPELRKSQTSMLSRYRVLFSDRIFVGMLLLGGLNFAGLFSYLSASPFVFQGIYGLSPQQYGLLFALNSIAVVIGVQVSARVVRRVGPQWVIAVATAVQFSMAVLIVVFDRIGLGFFGTLIPLWFYILATGFIFPCVQVIALANHGARAGTAASLLGAATFGLAGVISPLVGAWGTSTATPMGAIMAACIGLGILTLWLVVQPKKVPPL